MIWITAIKLVIKAAFWVVLAPFLAIPYYFAVTKIIELVPGSRTHYDTQLEWIQASLGIGYYSILILAVTGPFIGIGAHFLNRWSQQHFGSKAQWLLCATLVGWFHCVTFILFAEPILLLYR